MEDSTTPRMLQSAWENVSLSLNENPTSDITHLVLEILVCMLMRCQKLRQ